MGYAIPRRRIESSSGVMDGRERRHGLTASSKTEDRFVRCRISDLLSRIGLRSSERRAQPRALNAKPSSSISASRGGTSSGKCTSIRLRFSGYLPLAMKIARVGWMYRVLRYNPRKHSRGVHIVILPRLGLRIQRAGIKARERDGVEVLPSFSCDGWVFCFCEERFDSPFEDLLNQGPESVLVCACFCSEGFQRRC